jgi:outer membrane protein assembly factor BamB
MTESPSFACPWCGGIISHQEPGGTFACPYCKAKVTAPYAGQAPIAPAAGDGADAGAGARIHLGPGVQIHGNVQVTAGGGLVITRKRVEGELLSCSAGEIAIGYHADIGFALIGKYTPEGQPPRLRAIDAVNKRVAWEALSGQSWIEDLSSDAIGVHGRNVYIANNRSLVVLDLFTGTQRWATQLADKVETSYERDELRGPAIIDPFPADGRGAVMVLTVDHQLSAFDRDTGHPLWQRPFEGRRDKLRAILGQSVVAAHVAEGGSLEILNPGYAAPVATVGVRDGFAVRGISLDSGMIVANVGKQLGDDEEEKGVAVIDPSSGRVVGYEKVEDLGGGVSFDESVAIVGWGRIFAMVDNGKSIQTGGHVVAAPLQDHKALALAIAGPTLFVLLEKTKGTSVRRLVGLDPQTLAMRFDLGELGTEPDDHTPVQLQSDGYSLVYVASPKDDDDDCELRACDTTSGRLLWRRPVGEWYGHSFIGGYLVYFSRREMAVLRPDNGEVLAQYPVV